MFRQIIVKNAHRRTASMTSQQQRAFHSPFAVLASTSPLTTPHHPQADGHSASSYEKHVDATPDPHVTPTGARAYVVSTPDPAHTHYEVPSGAYPNTSPYHHPPQPTSASSTVSGEKQTNSSPSSSSQTPAHPNTTNRAPMNESGVGQSASVRYRKAPGEMGERGGSDGGLGLMDENTTTNPTEELADRNPPPLSKEASDASRKGLKDAWKSRK